MKKGFRVVQLIQRSSWIQWRMAEMIDANPFKPMLKSTIEPKKCHRSEKTKCKMFMIDSLRLMPRAQ